MSLTTEQLRALCIKHGVHPNAEGKMPRNAWAALNELNDMMGSGEPHNLIKLPPLPEPDWRERVYGGHGNELVVEYFSASKMREYARQAAYEAEAAAHSRAAPEHIPPTPVEKPLFWVRPRSDGGYQGPIHDEVIEDVRRNSGAWLPLYLGAPPAHGIGAQKGGA